jgi:hypothetical protein
MGFGVKQKLLVLFMLGLTFLGVMIFPLIHALNYGRYELYVSPTFLDFGEVNTALYVIALDGVVSYGLKNLSRAVEGILLAAGHLEQLNDGYLIFIIDVGWGGAGGAVYGRVKLNVESVVVDSWELYRELVENGNGAIIVNAHGETMLVPEGYMKEEWVDKIAEAMLYRNVTWVHTAGYPFSHAYYQSGKEEPFKEKGFQQLMQHIGKPNIKCYAPYPETTLIPMNTFTLSNIAYSWVAISKAYHVQSGNPLNVSDFDKYTILEIWGADYLPGAIVKFATNKTVTNFGFYIHIGTNQTYDASKEPVDADFWRGYAGVAAAFYVVAGRLAAEDYLVKAREAIAKAENEGRTKGLNEAKNLLQEAWSYYYRFDYISRNSAVTYANKAIKVAENATKPTLLELTALISSSH